MTRRTDRVADEIQGAIAELLLRTNTAVLLASHDVEAADPGYRLRVSNTSGARPVGFRVRLTRRAASAVPG